MLYIHFLTHGMLQNKNRFDNITTNTKAMKLKPVERLFFSSFFFTFFYFLTSTKYVR